MSGIPRDYPVGMNGFPQVIRGRAAALQGEFLVRLISRDPHGRESLQHVMVVGDGAAEDRKDAVGPTPPERAPDPQQPAMSELIRNLIRAARCNEDITKAADPLYDRIALIEQANGRMRSGITEAIALLEDGTAYERMHVAGTLRGAL